MMRITPPRPYAGPDTPEPPRLLPWSADMPVSALSTAESLLIVTMRLWVHTRDQTTPTPWYGGLAAAGLADDGIPDFDMMIQLIAGGSIRPLDIARTGQNCFGACEIALLDILARLQRNERGGAIELLGGWLSHRHVLPVMRYAGSVAANLRAARLLVPRRARLS